MMSRPFKIHTIREEAAATKGNLQKKQIAPFGSAGRYFQSQKGLEVKDTNSSSKKREVLERLESRFLEQYKRQQREPKAAIILRDGELQ